MGEGSVSGGVDMSEGGIVRERDTPATLRL